jgi:hypothetical protein
LELASCSLPFLIERVAAGDGIYFTGSTPKALPGLSNQKIKPYAIKNQS